VQSNLLRRQAVKIDGLTECQLQGELCACDASIPDPEPPIAAAVTIDALSGRDVVVSALRTRYWPEGGGGAGHPGMHTPKPSPTRPKDLNLKH